jgi:hypothetical protein
MQLRSLLAVLSFLATAACGTSITSMPLNPPPRPMPPRAPEDVHVYTSGRPARNYHEIAVLESQQESKYSFDDSADVFGKMRAKAAQMGCDGLVVLGANDALHGRRTLHGYRGTCIVYE